MISNSAWFWISALLLAICLFVPICRIVWVLSVRRLQSRIARTLEPDELAGQLKRARFIALFLTAIFSFLFCLNLLGYPDRG